MHKQSSWIWAHLGALAAMAGCHTTPTTQPVTSPPSAAYDPCGGKNCGAQCSACPPGAPECLETAVAKACNMRGDCVPAPADCGVRDPTPMAQGYSPCAGKTCGAVCTVCPPDDATCVESSVIKMCNAQHECTPTQPDCP